MWGTRTPAMIKNQTLATKCFPSGGFSSQLSLKAKILSSAFNIHLHLCSQKPLPADRLSYLHMAAKDSGPLRCDFHSITCGLRQKRVHKHSCFKKNSFGFYYRKLTRHPKEFQKDRDFLPNWTLLWWRVLEFGKDLRFPPLWSKNHGSLWNLHPQASGGRKHYESHHPHTLTFNQSHLL